MKKDHGISVTEVRDDGEINIYDMMTDAAGELNVNVGMISNAITVWQHYKNAYWYKTSEYNEEMHQQKIKELNKEKEIEKLSKPKKRRKKEIQKKIKNGEKRINQTKRNQELFINEKIDFY